MATSHTARFLRHSSRDAAARLMQGGRDAAMTLRLCPSLVYISRAVCRSDGVKWGGLVSFYGKAHRFAALLLHTHSAMCSAHPSLSLGF
jgi:hypothetical protein